jgi:hypothetical protein
MWGITYSVTCFQFPISEYSAPRFCQRFKLHIPNIMLELPTQFSHEHLFQCVTIMRNSVTTEYLTARVGIGIVVDRNRYLSIKFHD